ncbi:hypothetical protein [uncultured Sphingomonas sp.]|uniref:hypothetical protein n=1 Tax=uncultured Sphingomonas sp. TaxID=158754 RepID=UPI0025DFC481|nr:hypothetical protein [uncultured Sphingomonas sp.]
MTFAVLAAASLLGSSAMATTWASDEVADRYGAAAIQRGDFRMEPRLNTAFENGDHRLEVLLNLAAMRMYQQEDGSARQLYEMVLAQPNIDMTTPHGTAWSHDIANRALTRLGN